MIPKMSEIQRHVFHQDWSDRDLNCYNPGILIEGMRKSRTACQKRNRPGQNSKQAAPKYIKNIVPRTSWFCAFHTFYITYRSLQLYWPRVIWHRHSVAFLNSFKWIEVTCTEQDKVLHNLLLNQLVWIINKNMFSTNRCQLVTHVIL
jgi:hypothetical protein